MDKQYWNRYYREKQAPDFPTPFALDMEGLIRSANVMVDLGAGNGRDSLHFARLGCKVIACDQSAEAMDLLCKKAEKEGLPLVTFCGDFSRLEEDLAFNALPLVGEGIDLVYSRFSIHAVSQEDGERTVGWASRVLKENGLFLIEARTEKDALFGVGERVSNQAFFTDHYRRFLRLGEVVRWMERFGLEVIEAKEGKGNAVFGDEDPVVLRVIAQKGENVPKQA